MQTIEVIKVKISHRSKPLWAIKYPSGHMHGERIDDHGFKRFSEWGRKRDAEAFLNKLTNDAKELFH